MGTKSLIQKDAIRKAIIKEFQKCQPSAITFQKNSYKSSLKVNQSNYKTSRQTMDDNQDFLGMNPDLYEEVLVSESLDQYEGLLNHSKSTKKCPQGSRKVVKGPSSLDLN